MSEVKHAAPQFLVDDLKASIAFYEDQLGFSTDFVYDEFYAGVSRGGAVIHLKHADKCEADRTHRKSGEHLDALIDVVGARDLYNELNGRKAAIAKPLESRPWGAVDFYVEDPDGYILCFSEGAD